MNGSFGYRAMAYLVNTTVYDLYISAVTTTTITAETTTTTKYLYIQNGAIYCTKTSSNMQSMLNLV